MNRTQHLLSKLAEECAEVAQIAIKTALFGMDDIWDSFTITNRQRIHAELNDLMSIIDMLNNEAGLSFTRDENDISLKKERVNFFAEYSKKRGLLNE